MRRSPAADGLRACARRHTIENGTADGDLGLLSRKRARPKAPADQSFVAPDGSLDQGTPAIAGGSLPFQPSVSGDGPDVTIPLTGWSGVITLHSRDPWRNDNPCGGAAFQDGAVGWVAIIGSVRRELVDLCGDPVKQRPHLRGIVRILIGQGNER